jgi:release factor glutamine methyltransferase
MTIKQAIEQASSRVGRFEASELCAFALNFSKAELIRDYNRTLTTKLITRLETLLSRREAAEPLAYILGEWEFYGLPLYITPDVLVPRSTSEPLVLAALNVLHAPNGTASPRILDLCCGSGCLGLAVLANFQTATTAPNAQIPSTAPNATLVAVDISPPALELTAKNAKRNNLTDRVTCVNADALKPPPTSLSSDFDIILCNPPYISADEMPTLDASVLREPRIALTDEADGLTFYKSILQNWAGLLKKYGTLILECAAAQERKIELLEESFKVSVMAENTHKMSITVETGRPKLHIIPTGELKISKEQKENVQNG